MTERFGKSGNVVGALDHFHGLGVSGTNVRVQANTTFFGVVLVLNLMLFALLPLFLVNISAWWLLLLAPVCMSALLHWALIHEATHGLLHPNRWANRMMGRMLGIAFLCPYDVLRFGHLCHHALNGRPSDRPELYDPARVSRFRASLVYYFRLLVGLYAGELLCTLIAFLPRPLLRRVARQMAYEGNSDSLKIPDIAERQLTTSERIWPIRLDALLILCAWGLAIWAWGWMVWVFLIAVIGRGALVSLYDNAPHYGVALGDIHQGNDTALPRAIGWMVLNANLHGTHHRNPTLPWSALPAQFAAEDVAFRGGYFTSPLRQLRGVIPREKLGDDGAVTGTNRLQA